MYPALSIAQATISGWGLELPAAMTDASIPVRDLPLLWLGSRGGLEAGLVNRAGLPFRAIRGSGIHGVGWRLPLNAYASSPSRRTQPPLYFLR